MRGTNICISSLLAAGRHQELPSVLALRRYPSWLDRRFGVQVLVSQGRIEEALAYAEACRGLNQPDGDIHAACEKVLLDAGRADEAYEQHALTMVGIPQGVAVDGPGNIFAAIAEQSH